jgi:UDP-glucuronate 4-epimerase
MSDSLKPEKTHVFVTGSAGFIGFHLSRLLLEQGFSVTGYDAFTDYYDVGLKWGRNGMLRQFDKFTLVEGQLEDFEHLKRAATLTAPQVIVHLAAQAGVRYSLENPRAYIDANLVGAFNVMELARELEVKHLMMASTSSVYGANDAMPFNETERTDTQLTLYAATKKANESMAHSYSHLWKIPTTMFRFFTVYGPWGRPDMALFKFVDAMLDGKPIDIYNHGDMSRDFTYVIDLVRGIRLLMDCQPDSNKTAEFDSLSPVAPFRVVNIGNSERVSINDFVEAIETCLDILAVKNYMPAQLGDVPATWADNSLLRGLTGFSPEVSYREGIAEFVSWYREYYRK